MQFRTEDGWVIDSNNNRANIELWGSDEAAADSLKTLINCRRCINCSRCSDCSDCIGCSDCGDSSGCSYCSYCSRCSDCSSSSDCSYCSRCSDCSSSSSCRDSSGCSYCSYCSRCSDCSSSSSCRDCSDCCNNNEKFQVPVIENIHKKVYAAVTSTPDALNMSEWHTCDTTHCRGGIVVTLAGADGRELEKKTSTAFAAMQIYKASGYKISPVRFYDDNETAMADMKRLAEVS